MYILHIAIINQERYTVSMKIVIEKNQCNYKIDLIFIVRSSLLIHLSIITNKQTLIGQWTSCALILYHHHPLLHQNVGAAGFYRRTDDRVPHATLSSTTVRIPTFCRLNRRVECDPNRHFVCIAKKQTINITDVSQENIFKGVICYNFILNK